MKDIDYATAVARVRVNETRLLNESDIERLITAKTLDEAVALLNEKGYSSAGEPIERLFDGQAEKAWALVREIAPDFSEFHFLLVKNDFHNLKAILKCTMTGSDPEGLLIYPVITPIEVMKTAVEEQRWSLLPSYMSATAEAAYAFFINSGDGRLSDICIDKGALSAAVLLSKNNKNEFIRYLGDLIAVTYNLRIAVRCAKLGLSKEATDAALCRDSSLDCGALSAAAAAGMEELTAFLSSKGFEDAAERLGVSIAEFEKWCDDKLIGYAEKAGYSSFTAAPIAAYILKKEAEIKTARIIIFGKSTGMSEEEIRRRIRRIS